MSTVLHALTFVVLLACTATAVLWGIGADIPREWIEALAIGAGASIPASLAVEVLGID